MHRHLARLALLLSFLLAGAAATAGPAAADRVVLPDPVGDTWTSGRAGEPRPTGSVPSVDVTGTSVSHRTRALVVTVTYADLRARTFDLTSLSASIRTPGAAYTLVADVDEHGFGVTPSLRTAADREPVRCPRLAGRSDFAADTVRIGVPRACLGAPRWVRLRGLASSYSEQRGVFFDPLIGAGPRPDRHGPRVGR